MQFTSASGRRKKTNLYNTLSPAKGNWIAFASGKRGLSFNTEITQHTASVQLVIERDSEAEARLTLNQLKANKDKIEQSIGGPLEWYDPKGVKLCRIVYEVKSGSYRDDELKWPEIQDAIIDAMVRLEKALQPFIQLVQ